MINKNGRSKNRDYIIHRSSKVLGISFLSLLTACGSPFKGVEKSADTAAKALGCSQFKSKVFDSMYDYLDQENQFPDMDHFHRVMGQKIEEITKEQGVNDQDKVTRLKEHVRELYEILMADYQGLEKVDSPLDQIRRLIRFEMENKSNEVHSKVNSAIQATLLKIENDVQSTGVQCVAEEVGDDGSLNANSDIYETKASSPIDVSTKLQTTTNNLFSNYYQSCRVLDLNEVDSSTKSVSGISIIGTHTDKIGKVRAISSLSSVQATHPYIKVAGSNSPSCFNVYNNPLIYDYGGSPAVSGNTINFFSNSGSGGKVLGFDCSAYVSANIALAGFKYSPGVANKPIYVRNASADFIDAKASNFQCFDNITMTPTSNILPGDIGAVRGHVIMIDSISTDPFGLNKVSSLAGCSSLDYRNFDFIISQSSPSKGGIGLNKYQVRDYMASEAQPGTKMGTLFLEMGKAACKAKFSKTNIKPASANYGFIRHKGTPECLDKRVVLQNESCVNSCWK